MNRQEGKGYRKSVSISRRCGIKQAEGRGPGGTSPGTETIENGTVKETCALMTRLPGGEGQRPQPLSAGRHSNKLREPGQEGTKEVTRAATVGENHLKLQAEGPETHLNGYKVPHLKQNQLWLHFTCLC